MLQEQQGVGLASQSYFLGQMKLEVPGLLVTYLAQAGYLAGRGGWHAQYSVNGGAGSRGFQPGLDRLPRSRWIRRRR